jgi:hypothetical protein
VRSRSLVATAAAAAAIVSAAILAVAGSAQVPGPRTLTFNEVNKGSTFGFVDNPPRSPRLHGFPTRASVGDSIALSQPLADQAGRPAGTLHVSCTTTRPGRFDRAAFVCDAVARLRDGNIALEAALRFADIQVTAAVTGGTGAYNGARGTFTSRGERPTVDTFVLLP